MSTSISIPHQHVVFASGIEGTIRGILATGADGHAHGHLAFALKDGARRYRALTGAPGKDVTLSVQLEQLRTESGLIELASLDIQVLGDSRYPGKSQDASIVLRSLPDSTEVLRATVLLEIESDPD
jgi:hypothetical protein